MYDKCHFVLKKVAYLGHTVVAEDLKPDPTKLSVVRNWPTAKNMNKLRSFHGLVSHFPRFIQGHALLQELLQKGSTWKWGAVQQ
jgi:hypothetical protein